MAGSIVCGVDDSESGRGAARVARHLSRERGVDLIFVRAIEDGSSAARIDATSRRLEHLRAAASNLDSGARWVVSDGRLADCLAAAATASAASLIVVGADETSSSPRDGLCDEVTRRTLCPVVVVPAGGTRPPMILARRISTGRRPVAEPQPSSRDDWVAACEPLMRWEWEGGASAPTDS